MTSTRTSTLSRVHTWLIMEMRGPPEEEVKSLPVDEDNVQCEECGSTYDWDTLPSAQVEQKLVHLGYCHGDKYGWEVQGWHCPNCGQYNEV